MFLAVVEGASHRVPPQPEVLETPTPCRFGNAQLDSIYSQPIYCSPYYRLLQSGPETLNPKPTHSPRPDPPRWHSWLLRQMGKDCQVVKLAPRHRNHLLTVKERTAKYDTTDTWGSKLRPPIWLPRNIRELSSAHNKAPHVQ